MDVELVRYRTDEGTRPALVSVGHKWIHVVEFGFPLGARKVPVSEGRYMTRDLTYKGQPYPMARAVKLFKAAARKNGITERAKAILASAV